MLLTRLDMLGYAILQDKCYEYFPSELDMPVRYGRLIVTNKFVGSMANHSIVKRVFEVRMMTDVRSLKFLSLVELFLLDLFSAFCSPCFLTCRLSPAVEMVFKNWYAAEVVQVNVAHQADDMCLLQPEAPPHYVLHLEYFEWPDFRVPSTTVSLREMMRSLQFIPVDAGPFVVHCRFVLTF